jgi:hypothetical protein
LKSGLAERNRVFSEIRINDATVVRSSTMPPTPLIDPVNLAVNRSQPASIFRSSAILV